MHARRIVEASDNANADPRHAGGDVAESRSRRM